MAYADYTYYTSEYLMGMEQTITDEKTFLFWEKKARTEIDAVTFGRIAANTALISEPVKECSCAITELLYKANVLSESASANGMTGVMTSYSNDGQSGTFDISQSVYTESGKKAEIRRLINLYLGNTGLLYAGVDCES